MEYIGKNIVMEQPPDAFRLTSDAVEIGNFFKSKTTDTAIDIGCGTGVLSLMIAQRVKKVFAVDINETAVKQAKINTALNNLSNVEVICADIRKLHKTMGANFADIIICNPPYFGTGEKPKNSNKRLARHNETLSLNDLATTSTKLLKYGGIIYFCYPADRTANAIMIFENNNFRIKELKFISNEKGVYLTLFKCKKGGGDNTKIIV
jgi:tRNA1Val (adenine37-N6)-methyltransferase